MFKMFLIMAVVTFKTPYWYEITYRGNDFSTRCDTVQVLNVLDGDTFTVLHNNKTIRIRLYGIDCPELNQEYGLNARHILASMIINQNVVIKNTSLGKYGRTIAMVYLNDICINSKLISLGAAWVYDQYCSPEIRKQWSILQYEAKKAKIGLWQFENPVRPSVWRHL